LSCERKRGMQDNKGFGISKLLRQAKIGWHKT
jgi:hypothetical protein